jgi:hypothetical protein
VEPVAELHEQFGGNRATVTPWAEGRPHVTPMVSVWLDGALYFSTGHAERKAQNLALSRTMPPSTAWPISLVRNTERLCSG